MAGVKSKNTLSGLKVRDAMRRQFVRLRQDAALDSGVAALIKFKVNALLTTDTAGHPAGVVSKTDIVGAYYADLPLDTPLETIMNAPPQFCLPEESLESALDRMRERGIYRLYVVEGTNDHVVGVLAYPDVVGLLYRYCHDCRYSRSRHDKSGGGADAVPRFRVREVMTAGVMEISASEPVNRVIEEISRNRFGALLIVDGSDVPSGVVSKTDLVLAYKHRIDPNSACGQIMSGPVGTCEENDLLEDAVRQMILADVQRLFVHRQTPEAIVGVVSLSDMTRVRSGSCHACVSSRIRIRR